MHRTRILRRTPPGPLHRHILELCADTPSPEQVVHVSTAKVVLANYAAITNDFPYLRSREFKERYSGYFCPSCHRDELSCNDAIDQWIIDNAAFISLQQTSSNSVNSKIVHDESVERAFRPPGYGRALVVPVNTGQSNEGAGLLDIKGAGVAPGRTPSHDAYSNGLEYLGVAIADFFYGWLIDKIFARTVPGYWTVPIYAVLDLGFDITGGWHGTAPAGLHVRRAHRRNSNGYQVVMSGSENELVQLQIEMLLRSFGLTSTNAGTSFEVLKTNGENRLHFGGKVINYSSELERKRGHEIANLIQGSRLEMINIQLMHGATWEPRYAQMYDFGHISARGRFLLPTASTAQDRYLEIGHIICPDHPAYIHPDPGLRVDPDLFHRHSVNALGFYFAQGYREGRIERATVENAVRIGIMQAFKKKRLVNARQ